MIAAGADATAETVNNAFLSRTQDSSTVAKISLLKPSGSGNTISDVQLSLSNLIDDVADHETRLDDLEAEEVVSIAVYVDDAAYVAANGAAAAGDVYFNSGSGKLRFYDGSVWADVGTGTGGGGGGSIQWVEDANAPLATVENFVRVYKFGSGLAQKLYTIIRVPASYEAGNPIKLTTYWYSPDSSGTSLIQAISTLIRPNGDDMTSTTNQHTSTNAAVTNTVMTQNKPQEVILDLTDGSGEINAVAVQPGHMIIVALTRGTDTGTSDLCVPVNCAEVSFA